MRNISLERIDINFFKLVKCIHHREGSEEHLRQANDINYFKVVKCIHHREGSDEHPQSRELTFTISKL